jgi:excisionase family DNA binding protein
MLEGYVTVAQAARLREEPEHIIRRRIARGELEATKVGVLWLIPLTALESLATMQKDSQNGEAALNA